MIILLTNNWKLKCNDYHCTYNIFFWQENCFIGSVQNIQFLCGFFARTEWRLTFITGVDSLILVGRKRDRGKTRLSFVVVRDFCSLTVRAHRCRRVSSSVHWRFVSYRFLALVCPQCSPFFWGLLQMLQCFICLSKSGVRDNGKQFVERQRAKETINSDSQMDYVDELCKLTVCHLYSLQTCKTSLEKHSVLLLTFRLSISKILATRSSKP